LQIPVVHNKRDAKALIHIHYFHTAGHHSFDFFSTQLIKTHLRVYSTLPSLQIRSKRLGVVIQCASDFLEFRKKVSGIQIFPTMLLLSISTFMELLNFRRLSYHVWAKIISMVYS